MKKIFTLFILLVLTLTLTSCTTKTVNKVYAKEGTKTVAILKYGTHTSLDEIEEGIVNEIKKNSSDLVIKTYDCNFDSAIINQTLTAIKDLDLACIVAIATPVAVAACNTFTDIPVVFAAVSDPVSANVVGANVTGTSDQMQLDLLIDLAQKVDSNAKTFGYIYTETEANSNANLVTLKELAKSKNFTLKTKTITQTYEITDNLNSLIDQGIDSLIVTDDNNVAAGMDILSDICARNNIGVYCAADSEVRDGGMMGYSISYSKLAEYTGQQVLEIVKNRKAVSEVPVKYFNQQSDLNLYYNSDFLKKSSKYNTLVNETIKSKGTDLSKR